MTKKMDALLEEIHENSVKDREALTKVRDEIVTGFDPADQFARSATADSVARLSDSLSKINVQLLEIAKIHLKEKIAKDRAEAGDDDPDSMFDEIGDSFEHEEDSGTN